ncbi:hypothetical protein NEOKW01_0156 [Nematocida sp. AWRm80]|nr:hypothetical protein NEOKW01_0156 [Nematocida sp. AWRm80]
MKCITCLSNVNTLLSKSSGNSNRQKHSLCSNCKNVSDPYINSNIIYLYKDILLFNNRSYYHILYNYIPNTYYLLTNRILYCIIYSITYNNSIIHSIIRYLLQLLSITMVLYYYTNRNIISIYYNIFYLTNIYYVFTLINILLYYITYYNIYIQYIDIIHIIYILVISNSISIYYNIRMYYIVILTILIDKIVYNRII